MILVELNGGLGNQLFQYASAKSLSLFHSTELKLDTSYYIKSNKEPEIFNFNIPDTVSTQSEIESYTKAGIFDKVANKFKLNHLRKVYREPYFHYDKNFYNANADILLKGLRQSEKYFLKYENKIKDLLTLKTNLIAPLNDKINQIKTVNSVSIHIRRGDYLSPIALKVLGLVPLEYYLNGMEIISDKISNPLFFVFSDDVEWVEKNLKSPFNIEIISNYKSKNSIEDFYLMSQCKHNIIANSSFSWWAAWLNPNPGKMVIAPKKWFNKGPQDTQDLFPPLWTLI